MRYYGKKQKHAGEHWSGSGCKDALVERDMWKWTGGIAGIVAHHQARQLVPHCRRSKNVRKTTLNLRGRSNMDYTQNGQRKNQLLQRASLAHRHS